MIKTDEKTKKDDRQRSYRNFMTYKSYTSDDFPDLCTYS